MDGEVAGLIRTIAHFLRVAAPAYPTPEEAAEALIARLRHDGLRVIEIAQQEEETLAG